MKTKHYIVSIAVGKEPDIVSYRVRMTSKVANRLNEIFNIIQDEGHQIFHWNIVRVVNAGRTISYNKLLANIDKSIKLYLFCRCCMKKMPIGDLNKDNICSACKQWIHKAVLSSG